VDAPAGIGRIAAGADHHRDRRLRRSLPRRHPRLGEFHTFAHAGPIFSRPIACRPGAVVGRGGFVFADLIAGAA
jgi:hypothetical protein